MPETETSAGSDTQLEDDVIISWSNPRCCSTALMYAFAQSQDAEAFDERYGAWFKATGVERPYLDEVCGCCHAASCDTHPVSLLPVRRAHHEAGVSVAVATPDRPISHCRYAYYRSTQFSCAAVTGVVWRREVAESFSVDVMAD